MTLCMGASTSALTASQGRGRSEGKTVAVIGDSTYALGMTGLANIAYNQSNSR